MNGNLGNTIAGSPQSQDQLEDRGDKDNKVP